MLQSQHFLVLVLFTILGVPMLTGCLSKEAPETRFFVLSPIEVAQNAAAQSSADALSLELASVRLPPYLERPQLVIRVGGNQLKLLEFEQWGGNLSKNLARVVAHNLSRLLGTTNISIAPQRAPLPADARIEIEIMQFERLPDQHVHLIAHWRLLGARGQPALATRLTRLRSENATTSDQIEGTVAAMSELVGELSMLIADQIRRQIAQ